VPYHAGLRADARHECLAGFENGDARIVVATSAFGMGIDRGDVRFVLHYDLPLDLEDYCQQAGRAGRDGNPAECVLFYDPRDVRACRYLIERGYERSCAESGGAPAALQAAERERQQARWRLSQMLAYARGVRCPRAFIAHYFGEDEDAACSTCGESCQRAA
jgi:ATP-dependent DNA helicase RecQ